MLSASVVVYLLFIFICMCAHMSVNRIKNSEQNKYEAVRKHNQSKKQKQTVYYILFTISICTYVYTRINRGKR